MELSCPICGPNRFRRLFEKRERTFYACQGCGLPKQHPLPTDEQLREYYDKSYATGMYRTFAKAQEMKRLTALSRLKQLKGMLPFAGKWLDVGCANGVFVNAARELGIDAEGVELSEIAVAEARGCGLPVRVGTLADIPSGENYDCITAFDVLEHVTDPGLFLSQLVSLLKPSGMVVITVPNQRSYSAKLMRARWYFYIPDEHLHYFDPGTLSRLVSRHGLKPRAVRSTYKPLTFDYALTQFAEYNPWIFRILSFARIFLPKGV